jgi:thioredoxin 1
MASALTTLDRSGLDAYVSEPGVAILDWRHPKSLASVLFDQVLAHASRAQDDVRFGTIDISQDERLAREWSIGEAPTVMAFRDGVLVFSYAGPLPDSALRALIDAIWSLDMEAVRKGVDGHGSRLPIAFHPDREPPVETAVEDTASASGGPTPGTRH